MSCDCITIGLAGGFKRSIIKTLDCPKCGPRFIESLKEAGIVDNPNITVEIKEGK